MKHCRFFVTVAMMLFFFVGKAEEESVLPIIEMTTDRTTIYPQRMDLSGEETLQDLLQMYPDLILNASDNWLDGYSIRIDNGTYGGDMRVLLTELKAWQIQKVQISDNPGVAKATTGMNGVVDVFLMPMQQGVHGTVDARLSTELETTPSFHLFYGSGSTDILANGSYTFSRPEGVPQHRQFANFHMTNQLTERDQLVTYFTESYERMQYMQDTTRSDNRNYIGQLRHYHDFDRPATNLMTAVVYQHTISPLVRFSLSDGHTVSPMSSDWQGTVAVAQELNTPLVKNSNLMVGYEVDYGMGDQREEDLESQIAERTLTYRVMNADAYAEFDWVYRKFRFTLGDRVMFYRYRVDVPVGDRSHNDWRNMMHASVIYTPHMEHQIQAGFFHKFYNPSYMGLFREARGMTDEEWLLAKANITETNFNEVKVGYRFARQRLSVHFNAYYYNVAHTYDFVKLSASGYWKHAFFSVTGGVDFYRSKEDLYATFRLTPVFDLPIGMRIRANTVFYTAGAPARQYNYDCPVYADLRIDQRIGNHVALYAQWHDIFNGRYGVGLLGVQVRY